VLLTLLGTSGVVEEKSR